MKRSMGIVLLVFLVFFVISFITNILGPLVPDIIKGFSLSLTLAGFLPFSFFIAYGVMSIPAGVLLDRFGQKPILIAAFVLAFGGSFLFASFPTFTVALMSLFMIGIGMTMLQVAINPLLRVAGGEENFAFFSVMGQLVFGAASFLSPHVYSYLVTNLGGDSPAPAGGVLGLLARLVPSELPWVSLYWVFTVVTLVMIVVRPLVGLAMERYGRKYFLLMGLSAYILAMGVFTLADTLWMLYIARMIQGLGAALTWIATYTMAAELAVSGRRGEAIGMVDEAGERGAVYGSFIAFAGIVLGSALTMKVQYYKLVYEQDASILAALITGLVDLHLLPKGMRKLEAV